MQKISNRQSFRKKILLGQKQLHISERMSKIEFFHPPEKYIQHAEGAIGVTCYLLDCEAPHDVRWFCYKSFIFRRFFLLRFKTVHGLLIWVPLRQFRFSISWD